MSHFDDHLTARIAEADATAQTPFLNAVLSAYHRGLSDGLRYARLYYVRMQRQEIAPSPDAMREEVQG